MADGGDVCDKLIELQKKGVNEPELEVLCKSRSVFENIDIRGLSPDSVQVQSVARTFYDFASKIPNVKVAYDHQKGCIIVIVDVGSERNLYFTEVAHFVFDLESGEVLKTLMTFDHREETNA